MAIQGLMERINGGSSDAAAEEFIAPDDLSALDEAGDSLAPDPKPRRRGKVRAATTAAASGGRASAAQQRKVSDALTMLITLPAATWALRDPHCGGAAMAQRTEVVAALVPIVCRNPAMLRWFTGTSAAWLDWLALLTAVQPVGSAVWGHHVKKVDPSKQGPQGGDVLDLTQFTAD
jgi:hypothetical protein